LIDDLVVVALGIQVLFQVIGIAVPSIGAVPGGKAIPESNDDRPPIGLRRIARRIRNRGGFWRRSLRRFRTAAGKQGSGEHEGKNSSASHSLTLEESWPVSPPKVTKKASAQQLFSLQVPSLPPCHPHRSKAQWRDLRFSGPFLEMFLYAALPMSHTQHRGNP
jgi:hypothetical protein